MHFCFFGKFDVESGNFETLLGKCTSKNLATLVVSFCDDMVELL